MEEKDPTKMTYAEAIAELDTIVREMQSERCGIDNLSALTTRSLALLKVCKDRLTATDEEIKKILSTIEQQ